MDNSENDPEDHYYYTVVKIHKTPTFLGKGVDIVYDAVGGPTSIETLRCVNFGARFCIVGWTSTPFVAKGKISNRAHCLDLVLNGLLTRCNF